MKINYPDRQIRPTNKYMVRDSYSKIRRGKMIEIGIYISCISIVGYVWVWILAIWWLISFRRADEEFIHMWKNVPEFEERYPFQRKYHELITTDRAYQQKIRTKNATKILIMAVLAIPILGYILILTVTALTFGIVLIIYYYRLQIPHRYLKQIITHDLRISSDTHAFRESQSQAQTPTEKGIFCGRCGKKLPQRARYCNICAYPVNIPQQKEVVFRRVSFKQAVDLLDSETFPRSSRMNIEFECLVQKPASPKQTMGPAPYRKIRVTDPGQLITRTLYIWGDQNKKHNIQLAGSLEKGDRLLVMGPNRPKDDPRYYRDEAGQDVFWISSWDGTALGSGTRLLKLQTITPTQAEEEPIPVKSKDIIEFKPETPVIRQSTITPPFYCQLCSIKHKAGTPRMQCDTCGRYVCVEAFAEMAQVGRTSCPMCDGKLSSI
ncbi:MAG: hypothetical protein ACXADY_14210 [Candidatus Hodarchaeales archaeon]|jgi:hypothetical protein